MRVLSCLGNSAKNLISDAMTMVVIDRLEMVNVDHVATQRLLIAAGHTPQFVEGLKERAPVETPSLAAKSPPCSTRIGIGTQRITPADQLPGITTDIIQTQLTTAQLDCALRAARYDVDRIKLVVIRQLPTDLLDAVAGCLQKDNFKPTRLVAAGQQVVEKLLVISCSGIDKHQLVTLGLLIKSRAFVAD